MKFRVFIQLVILAGATFLLDSCYPNRAEFVDELDIVVTDYDPEFFNTFTGTTYYMPDSIARVTDPGNPRAPELDPEDDAEILAGIESNFEAFGYERWDETMTTEKADIVVLVSANSSTSTSIWWPIWGWWPGWGYYPPGWGPGWGWGGPVVSTTTVGSLIVRIVDPNNPDTAEEEIPVVWQGVINGLLQGSNSSIVFRANNGVDQMFTQSPYLDQN
jgi:hypothetical protein